jgi:hypothetical protein
MNILSLRIDITLSYIYFHYKLSDFEENLNESKQRQIVFTQVKKVKTSQKTFQSRKIFLAKRNFG